jgi:hypothetical protein
VVRCAPCLRQVVERIVLPDNSALLPSGNALWMDGPVRTVEAQAQQAELVKATRLICPHVTHLLLVDDFNTRKVQDVSLETNPCDRGALY